jgi:uncharacterized protein
MDDDEDVGIYGQYPDPDGAGRSGDFPSLGSFEGLGAGDPERALIELANARMPFGKYAGMLLVDLPENYVLWFKGKGYPEGRLGEQLRAIEEIKTNGLECLLRPIAGTGEGY